MLNRVWFITGASSGLGYAFTQAALEKGDIVAASARRTGPFNMMKTEYEKRIQEWESWKWEDRK